MPINKGQPGDHPSPPHARPSLASVLAAPWIFPIAPASAASRLANSTTLRTLAALAIPIAVGLLGIAFLALMDQTRTLLPRNAPALPTSPIAFGRSVDVRSLAEVWKSWVEAGRIEELLLQGAMITAAVLAAAALMAWLQLVVVRSHRTLGQDLGRAFRMTCAGSGLLCALTIMAGSLIVLASLARKTGYFYDATRPNAAATWRDVLEFASVISVLGSLAVLIAVISRACAAVADVDAAENAATTPLPPRCEGCGYDLTHIASDGRCTECGLDAAESLTPGRRRTGAPWQQRPGPASFLATTSACLLRPQRFYRAVLTRGTSQRALRFSRRQFWIMAVLCFTWVVCIVPHFAARADLLLYRAVIVVTAAIVSLAGWAIYGLVFDRSLFAPGSTTAWQILARLLLPVLAALCLSWLLFASADVLIDDERFAIAIAATIVAFIAAWSVHRLIAALISTWWFLHDALENRRAASVVFGFETCYLWLFCAFNGFMISSFVAFDDWITALTGRWISRFVFGMPAEPAVMLLGNLLILLLWTGRFHRALRHVRWANY